MNVETCSKNDSCEENECGEQENAGDNQVMRGHNLFFKGNRLLLSWSSHYGDIMSS